MTQEQYDYFNRLEGFKWWEDTKDLKDYEFIITVNSDGKFSYSYNVVVKYISQYDILYWARPQDLSPSVLSMILNQWPSWRREEYLEELKRYNENKTKSL